MVTMRQATPPALVLGPRLRTTCTILQVIPLPGVGAIIAGSRNPHSRYMGRGIAQLLLVLFGTWPLIVPGLIGITWAAIDAVRIHRDARPPGKQARPLATVIPRDDPEHPQNRKRRKKAAQTSRASRMPWRRGAAATKKGRPPLGPP